VHLAESDGNGYRLLGRNLRAAYRASRAIFRLASSSRSRCALSALTRSACSAASTSACCARSVSRVFVKAFPASRAPLIALRSAARRVRGLGAKLFQCHLLGNGGSLLPLEKIRFLKAAHLFRPCTNTEDLPVHVCTQFRQRTRHPTTGASMLPVFHVLPAPPSIDTWNGMT
jgi:hypothetical protein